MSRPRARFPFVASLLVCASCRTLTAPPAELDDYRAFRVAAAEGTRLARAKRYLDRYPEGAFADEVRRAFDAEEPRYFARAQTSREKARDYLVDLPEGPHANAARALLRALGTSMEDAELSDVAERARAEGVHLEALAARRRLVGQAVTKATEALLEPNVIGALADELPAPALALVEGPARRTWGTSPLAREEDLFFDLPTRPVRESRVLTVTYALEERHGAIAEGRIEGHDLFVRWAEADRKTPLDPTSDADRTEARLHAMDRLAPVLDARAPVSRCPETRTDDELFHRCCPDRTAPSADPTPRDSEPSAPRPASVEPSSCRGLEVLVRAGKDVGDVDSIVVRDASRAPALVPARVPTPRAPEEVQR